MPYADPARARANQIAYYAANRERILASQRAARAADSERFRDRDRQRYAANPDARRASNAAYRRSPDRREKAAAVSVAWRAANPERVAAWRTANAAKRSAQHAVWAAAHRDELKAYQAAYHAAHADAIRKRHVATDRARYVADPTPFYSNNRRRRARQAGAAGAHTPDQLQARRDMWGDRCWMCHDARTADDHAQPLSEGGSNWPANLRPICQPCNSSKGNQWPFDLRRRWW